MRGNEQVSKLIEVDTRSIRKPRNLIRELSETKKRFKYLREETYDLVIDFQGLLKSALISKIARSKLRAGFAVKALREPAAKRFYDSTHEVSQEINVIFKNIELAEKSIREVKGLEELSLQRDNLNFAIETDESHKREAEEVIERLGADDFVILNPAGGWPTKLWAAENYGRLADELSNTFGLSSVVSVGPGEEELAERAIKASNNQSLFIVKPTLKGFFELAKRASCYVGGDTAPTHLAVAAKCPVVGIFGPTEWWRNGSINSEDICVERNDIGCRIDCHRRSCDQWICMDIEVSTVLLAIKQRLGL